MKKFLLGIVAAVSFFSCQEEELLYSCDKEVNSWAKTNMTAIEKMNTPEFLTLENSKQKAAYRVFHPAKRKQIWVNKINETLSLEWTKEEAEHIKKLLSIFDRYPMIYTGGFTEEERAKLDVDIYKWVKYAEDVLEWDRKLISSIAANPNKLKNTKGDIINNTPLTRAVKSLSESSGTCNCNHDYWFISDCEYNGCNSTLSCNATSFGCGMSWGDPCIGKCWGTY